jgi:hypothetical protein
VPRRRNPDLMRQVGVTPSGERVMAGLFAFYDTYGLPLEFIFEFCRAQHLMPSWLHLRDEALAAGWSRARLHVRLAEALGDVYGGDFRNVVIGRLALTEG